MTPERRKRIDRLKKIIVRTILLMILLPLIGCIILGIKLSRADKTLDRLADRIVILEGALKKSVDEKDRTEAIFRISESVWQKMGQEAENEQAAAEVAASAVSGNDHTGKEVRKVYFTFDDGPSIYTEDILDILAQYNVKATFFVTGKRKEMYADTYRRIVEEGHTLGMHSYSHEYSDIYASVENFRKDIERLNSLLYNETGVISRFYRFPGGSSNKVSQTDINELMDYLDAMDITFFDWNISAGDAMSTPVSSEYIVNRVMTEIPRHKEAVILMHDAAGKRSTVDALPILIEKIRALEEETEILPITEETPPVRHTSEG